MTGPRDMGSSSTMRGRDFPPMPPMPAALGMGTMRDSAFSRGNDYGMFSRRSPPPSGNNGRFR